MLNKICTKCKIKKPVGEFLKKKTPAGVKIKARCKLCEREDHREAYRKHRQQPGAIEKDRAKGNKFYAEHKNGIRDHNIRCRYGLEPEKRLLIFMDQDGRCKICKKFVGFNAIHIDHDHETGEIRGLLCGNCNFMLGHAKDDIVTLKAAIKYLQRARVKK